VIEGVDRLAGYGARAKSDFDPIVALAPGYPAEVPAGNPRVGPVVHWHNSDAAPTKST
jgi:hypothetical protein